MHVQGTQETHDTQKKMKNTVNTFMPETGLSA